MPFVLDILATDMDMKLVPREGSGDLASEQCRRGWSIPMPLPQDEYSRCRNRTSGELSDVELRATTMHRWSTKPNSATAAASSIEWRRDAASDCRRDEYTYIGWYELFYRAKILNY
jgi:hypothetical protein